MEDFEEVNDEISLEQTEDATYRTKKDFFGREQVLSYPYSSAEDFKKLTPDQIVTRRIKLIKPNVEAGQSTKKVLTESQRKALLRLMAIKNQVELLPKEKQDRVRADLISRYEMNKPNEEDVEILMDEALLLLKYEKLSAEQDKKLMDRLEKLRGVIPTEAELIERFKKLRGPIPSEAELRKRLNELRTKGGSKKTRKARKARKSTKSRKSTRKYTRKSTRKSTKSRKTKPRKATKARKTRNLVKH
jgi:hypothetical protein